MGVERLQERNGNQCVSILPVLAAAVLAPQKRRYIKLRSALPLHLFKSSLVLVLILIAWIDHADKAFQRKPGSNGNQRGAGNIPTEVLNRLRLIGRRKLPIFCISQNRCQSYCALCQTGRAVINAPVHQIGRHLGERE